MAQPIYITMSSSGSSPWKTTTWHVQPIQIGFAVLSTGGSSWAIDVTLEDPTATFPNPISSAPTAFSILAGSSNQVTSLTSFPIAGYRLTLNVPSSVGAKVTLVSLQAGVSQ